MNDNKWSSFSTTNLVNLWFEVATRLWNGDLGSGDIAASKDPASTCAWKMLDSLINGWRALDGIQFGNPMVLAGLCKTVFDRFHSAESHQSPTPCTVVYEKDRVRLMHYSVPDRMPLRHPLLVVYSLINRYHILDLQPDRSLIRHMLDRGIEVYLIDWGYPAPADHHLSIDDHVNGYLAEMVDVIRRTHHLSGINLMGVCMGGTLAVIYAALHPHKVANLITTVTPTQFDVPQDPLHTWLKAMDVDAILATFGNMPGLFLVLNMLMLTPVRLLADKYARLFQKIGDQAFIETFLRLERWTFDSPDIPGELFRQFIKDCYQQNLLIDSRMKVGGKRVNLKNINMPLLNVFGKADHFVKPDACSHLMDSVGSRDTKNLGLDTGHLGLFVSHLSQQALSQQLADWLAERDAAPPPRRRPVTKKSSVALGRRHLRRRNKMNRHCTVRGISSEGRKISTCADQIR